MADQSKSPFPFGNTVTSATSGGLFGQQNQNSQSQGSLFGSSSKPQATSGPSLFSTNTTTGGSPIFGSNNQATGQSSGLFGGAGGGGGAQKPTTSFSFGQKPPGESGGGRSSLFGQAQSSAGQQPGASAPFHDFATPNKPANPASTGASQTSNIFAAGTSGLLQNATSSTPTSAATPAGNPSFSFGGLGSTTPAHPPPSSQAAASNPFGLNLNNQQQEKKAFFSNSNTGTSLSQLPTSSSTTAAQNTAGAGSGLFPSLGNSQDNSLTQPSGGTNFFPNFAGQASATSSGGQLAPTSNSAEPSQSSASEVQKPAFSFSSLSQGPSQDPKKPQTSGTGLFSLNAQPKSFESSAPASSAPSTDPFGNLGQANNAGKSSAPSSSAASNFPGNLGKSQNTPASSAVPTNTTSHAATSNLFGKLGQPAASSVPPQSNAAPTTSMAETQGNANTAAGSTLGHSTIGPAPSAQSRLKNKSMDEIITRWASDLAKYQKEFQKQAEKVATWDHLLVENSEKIQKLYGSTLEAERATAEVERQITAVENDQNELESWLDRYEEKVDQMISNSGDSLYGPDLERERTYVMRTTARDCRLIMYLVINWRKSSRLGWTRWGKIYVA